MADLTDHDHALAKRAADFAELQQELSGTTAGRSERFLSPTAREDRDAQKDKKRKEEESALRRILLASASHRAAYEAFGQRLAEAEAQIAQAITAREASLEMARDTLTDIRDRAARLPDGTRVYLDAQGRLWTEEGRSADDMRDVVIFPEGAPSFEDYQNARTTIEDALRDLERLRRIQIDVLGRARDRYEDQDGPITQEEMQMLRREIEEAVSAPEASVAQADTQVAVASPNALLLPTLPTG